MKRIESPINPIQRIGDALFQFRYPLLGSCKLRPKPHVFCPNVPIDGGLSGGLDIVSPLRGVAYSHGLSTPFRATRLTRVSPSLSPYVTCVS
ncbi:hypothetical protein [Hyphomicrobium denitrificans]|uniref:hypothetical protein n=1 Tax=Hyphomicrobium denitrificans TaxID=53399 RepID=UPI0002F766D6|nr:hypothetical protein [Hyphomicrobium denitrificans]